MKRQHELDLWSVQLDSDLVYLSKQYSLKVLSSEMDQAEKRLNP